MAWGAEPPVGDIRAGDATPYIQPHSLLNSSGCEGACVLLSPLFDTRKIQLKHKTTRKLPLLGILL